MANVTFLNHSCNLVDSGKTKILCDPWFNGLAFHDGWSLLLENSHELDELDFDYIWISHEHPDHFSIPTLNNLSKSTQFLYQKTKDQKVKKYLESKGHSVIELDDKVPLFIGEDVEITSIVCYGFDSSILFRFEDNSTFLNVNDARVSLKNHLEIDIVPFLNNDAVDLVSTQFSYANWAGNPGDKDMPFYRQDLEDQKNKYIIDVLKPKACLLFASFVYYCHEENFYANENSFFTHILDELNNSDSKLILPIPDQVIDLSKLSCLNFDKSNLESSSFWKNHHEKALIKSNTKSIEDLDLLKKQYDLFFNNLWSKNSIASKSIADFKVRVMLDDIGIKIEIGLLTNSFIILDQKNEVDFSVSAETFEFLLKNNFGRGTVVVNSRIKFNYPFAHKFFIFFFIPYQNNIGIYFDSGHLLNKSDLINIQNISVLSSMYQIYPELKDQFILDCDNLFISTEVYG